MTEPSLHQVLKTARAFAEHVATPMFIADAGGNLVFYNAAAERVLGRRFAEAGEMRAEEWSRTFEVTRMDGTPVGLEDMPGGVALLQQQPAHGLLRITGLDRMQRVIAVTAVPLLATRDELCGVLAIFWAD